MKTLTSAELVARAQEECRAISPEEAIRLKREGAAEFIDVRDGLERQSKPCIPGSVHANRGMLEFYIDPASEFHNAVFRSDKLLVMVCGSGGRAALAAKTARDMGVSAGYLKGGMRAWLAAGGPTEQQ